MEPTSPLPKTCLSARLPVDVHTLLRRAAAIEGRTLTDFVISAARDAAGRTIAEKESIRLSLDDQRQMVEAMLHPPEPTPALRRAFQKHRDLFGNGAPSPAPPPRG